MAGLRQGSALGEGDVKSGRPRIARVLSYTVLILLAVIDVIPFIWMVLSSFKSRGEILHFPPALFPKIAFHNRTPRTSDN